MTGTAGFAEEPELDLGVPPQQESPVLSLAERIDYALQESIDSCARCKTCDKQVDAVMGVLREVLAQQHEDLRRVLPGLEHARDVLPPKTRAAYDRLAGAAGDPADGPELAAGGLAVPGTGTGNPGAALDALADAGGAP